MYKCRICLSEEEPLSDIFQMSDLIMISIKIMSLAKVQIHPDDTLPHYICSCCLKILNESYQFKIQCEYMDKKLRYLSDVNITDNINSDSQETDQLEIDMGSANLLSDFDKEISDTSNLDENKAIINEMFFGKDVHFTGKLNAVEKIDKVKYKSKKSKSKKEQCFTCGKVMSSRFRLKTHLQTHTGEKPFDCTECNKKFSSQQNLRIHMRTHTGEKPLRCTICGESFAHAAGLAAHKRKHTGEMPYHCSLCPRSFRTTGHLTYHLRRHTGEKNFECEICSRAFITRSDLKQHSLTHSGERRHVCNICGLRLTRSSHLKRHLKTHNKQYSCNLCESKFMQKSLFDKHKKKYHNTTKENIEVANSIDREDSS